MEPGRVRRAGPRRRTAPPARRRPASRARPASPPRRSPTARGSTRRRVVGGSSSSSSSLNRVGSAPASRIAPAPLDVELVDEGRPQVPRRDRRVRGQRDVRVVRVRRGSGRGASTGGRTGRARRRGSWVQCPARSGRDPSRLRAARASGPAGRSLGHDDTLVRPPPAPLHLPRDARRRDHRPRRRAGPRRRGRRLLARHGDGPPQPDPGRRRAGRADARGLVASSRRSTRETRAGPARHAGERRDLPQPGDARARPRRRWTCSRRAGHVRPRGRLVRGGARWVRLRLPADRRADGPAGRGAHDRPRHVRRGALVVRGPLLPHRRRDQRPAAGPARRPADHGRRRGRAADAPDRGQARGPDPLVPDRASTALARKTELLQRYCEAIGRDPSTIERTIAAPGRRRGDRGRGEGHLGAAARGSQADRRARRAGAGRGGDSGRTSTPGFTGFTFNNTLYRRPTRSRSSASCCGSSREAVPVPRRAGRVRRRPGAGRDRPPRRVDRLLRARLPGPRRAAVRDGARCSTWAAAARPSGCGSRRSSPTTTCATRRSSPRTSRRSTCCRGGRVERRDRRRLEQARVRRARHPVRRRSASASRGSPRRSRSSRAASRGEPFSFQGEHYTITDHTGMPTPVQRPAPAADDRRRRPAGPDPRRPGGGHRRASRRARWPTPRATAPCAQRPALDHDRRDRGEDRLGARGGRRPVRRPRAQRLPDRRRAADHRRPAQVAARGPRRDPRQDRRRARRRRLPRLAATCSSARWTGSWRSSQELRERLGISSIMVGDAGHARAGRGAARGDVAARVPCRRVRAPTRTEGDVDISLGEPRIYGLEPRLPFEDIRRRAEDKRASARRGRDRRPAPAPEGRGRRPRREPAAGRARCGTSPARRTTPTTGRAHVPVPASAGDVRSVTLLGHRSTRSSRRARDRPRSGSTSSSTAPRTCATKRSSTG